MTEIGDYDRRRLGVGCRMVSMLLFDTIRPTRALLAVVASMWAIGFALPGETLEHIAYGYMAYFASESTWVGIWTVLAIGLWWRTAAFRRSRWTILVDVYSVGVFSTAAACLVLAHPWPWPAASAPDITCAAAALWLLARSLAADGFGDHRGQ